MKRQHTYIHWDLMMASPERPMPKPYREFTGRRICSALDELTRGNQPTPDDWRQVADAINITETLVEMGIAQDESGLLEDAVTAMAKAAERYQKGGAIRMDGPGLQAVKAVVEDYLDLLEQVSERTLKSAHQRTEKRIWAILDGKPKPHDRVVRAI